MESIEWLGSLAEFPVRHPVCKESGDCCVVAFEVIWAEDFPRFILPTPLHLPLPGHTAKKKRGRTPPDPEREYGIASEASVIRTYEKSGLGYLKEISPSEEEG